MNAHKTLFSILIIGFALRLLLLVYFWDKPLAIVDETHYHAIAENILKHHEFALNVGHPTSIRPPLYPAFLSVIYYLTGGIHLNAVRIVQIILSLTTVFMVYMLGKKVFDEKIGLLAALMFSVYPSFLFFTHLILTEVLFTFLFIMFVWFFLLFIEEKKDRYIWWAGLFLGLGSLTRSILFPFLIVTLIFLLIICKITFLQTTKGLMLLTIGCTMVIVPWAVRNIKLYNSPVIIDTMGGLNMYMGNYEHTPLNRAWAAVDLTGEKAWYYGHEKILSTMNEAQKQEWAINKAKNFIRNHKLLTIKRDLIKVANFWGLERTVIGGILTGYYPEFNKKIYLVGITFTIFFSYALVAIGSVFGFVYNFGFRKYDVLFIVILISYFTFMHALTFGHPRYHLPLISLLAIFASWSLMNIKNICKNLNTWRFRSSIITSGILIFVWFREIVFIEGARYLNSIFKDLN